MVNQYRYYITNQIDMDTWLFIVSQNRLMWVKQ